MPVKHYSPDLAPSEFCLFGRMKDNLRGFIFSNLDDAKTALKTFLRKQSPGVFQNVLIPELTDRENVIKCMVTMLNCGFGQMIVQAMIYNNVCCYSSFNKVIKTHEVLNIDPPSYFLFIFRMLDI